MNTLALYTVLLSYACYRMGMGGAVVVAHTELNSGKPS